MDMNRINNVYTRKYSLEEQSDYIDTYRDEFGTRWEDVELFLIIANGLKNKNTISEIKNEVYDYLNDNGLYLDKYYPFEGVNEFEAAFYYEMIKGGEKLPVKFNLNDFKYEYNRGTFYAKFFVAKSRLKDIICGVKDSMDFNKCSLPPCCFRKFFEKRIVGRYNYKNVNYASSLKHYLYGVFLYRNFFENVVADIYSQDKEFYNFLISEYME